MEPSIPVFEEAIIYIGQFACVAGACYMIKIGQIKLGIIFLVGFVLQIQAGYVISNIDSDPEAQGECWAIVGSFYKCLPLLHRVSIHLGQLGSIILGLAVFLSAKQLNKTNKKCS